MSAVPAFVACAARSGSTLLRMLLDAHPDLACPAETDLAVLVDLHIRIGKGLLGDEAAARSRARGVAEGLMADHLARVNKRGWVDKSLSNAMHLDLLATTWPEARFVLLHRHCMDMVMSGLEASPWGLSEYGFAQVAQLSPTDSVVALAAYWADRTARMLDFEAQAADRVLRVRYEDLVMNTEDVLDGLFTHLGVRPLEHVPSLGAGPARIEGPADHTIWYTEAVHDRALGRGARVPPDHVQGPLRSHVNGLLERLGYANVDDAWGSGEGDASWPKPGELELRLVEGHRVLARERLSGLGPEARAVLGGGAQASRGGVVAIERCVLARLVSGEENLGAALRARLVRYYGPALRDFTAERALLAPLLTFLRKGCFNDFRAS
jgi:hypothetical protein